ncbi:MAG: two-component regulator propeller domain-containing protein [Candidatus Parabeggiatoa sp.]|nr:two-component regulator propeller domain-containing protein [Candidatus Parabeggiatoa sp.]
MITALETDGEGGLWIGTAAFYLEENGSTRPFSRSAGLAHLTKEGSWTVYNKDNSELPANDIQVLYLDDDDGLWIGTGYQHHSEPYGEAGGLAHRFPDGRWEVFNNQNTILQNSVQAIQSDERGGLWIGSYRGGIAHRKSDGAWELFATFNSGIPGNEVYSLATDGNHHLWLGTDNGVAHLSFGQTLSGDLSGQRAAILIYPESRGGTLKHLSSEKISSYAYQVLSERYYRNEDIYFVAYKPEMDINGDYRADINAVDAPVKFAEKANGAQTRSLKIDDIRQAFEWAKQQGTLNQPLLVVLVAEGLPEGQLLLNPDSNEALTAEDLKLFLDDYQASTGNPVVIVIEASYAGKLIPELASDENRIIITSTSADQATQHTDFLGQDAFIWRYFNELRRGTNFWDAFYHVSSGLSQQPQIEDNQRSGRLAKQFCLNGCFTLRLNQTVYHDGDTLRITLPPLPSGKVPYIGIGLPDGSAVYTLPEKNGFMPFDGTTLSAWQDGNVVVELPITSDLARGEYPLYLLRVKAGVEPLAHPEFWELNVGAMRVE